MPTDSNVQVTVQNGEQLSYVSQYLELHSHLQNISGTYVEEKCKHTSVLTLSHQFQ